MKEEFWYWCNFDIMGLRRRGSDGLSESVRIAGIKFQKDCKKGKQFGEETLKQSSPATITLYFADADLVSSAALFCFFTSFSCGRWSDKVNLRVSEMAAG